MVNNQTKLRIKDDIMFKAFFSRKENEECLQEFISCILKEKVKIKKVEHDARLEQLAKEDKYGILDIDVTLEDGKEINIEMQLKNYNNMEERTTFYASKKITSQKNIGKYYEGLKKVVIIAILDYDFTKLPEYITKTVRVAEKHREYEINNVVEYYYIELSKFRKENPDMKEKLNQWLAFIDGERRELIEMAKKNNKLVEKADENYNVLTGDAEIRRLEEVRMLSKMEGQAALKVAKEEGIKEEQLKIAKEMKKMNLDIEIIIKATGLNKEEIEKL